MSEVFGGWGEVGFLSQRIKEAKEQRRIKTLTPRPLPPALVVISLIAVVVAGGRVGRGLVWLEGLGEEGFISCAD